MSMTSVRGLTGVRSQDSSESISMWIVDTFPSTESSIGLLANSPSVFFRLFQFNSATFFQLLFQMFINLVSTEVSLPMYNSMFY